MMKKQSGQILVLAMIVVGFVLINTLIIISGATLYSQNSNYSLQATQATDLAEAGVNKAIASLNKNSSYVGENETLFENGSYSVSVTSPNASTKIIEATGYIPDKSNPKSKKTVKISATKGVGMAFNYGVQTGGGGFEMANNSKIEGSIYSNGNITMSNNTTITGDAYVAGGIAPSADQQSICVPPSCSDYIFGKDMGGNNILDVAQSFKPATGGNLNKVAVNLKKTGSPPDLTVRILADNSGKPNKNSILGTGTLTANLVTQEYSWIDVYFGSAVNLTQNIPYWIMLDTSSNSSNYWTWSADSVQGYTRGQPMWSPNWSVANPVWTGMLFDLDFKTYMGGVATYISGDSGAVIGGNAYANTLSNLSVTGSAYYQVKQNVTAAHYYPGSQDPPPVGMPISDGNITAWKQAASDAGIYTGNINSCRSALGPGKYIGDVTFSNGCTVTVNDPIWITGNLDLSNNVTLKLNSSYGAASGVIVVDGKISVANNTIARGSGTTGSYLMVLTTYDSRTNGQVALSVSNSTNQGILYAGTGIADISNNSHLTELTAWKIQLGNGVEIKYDQGLASSYFTSGPSGSFSLIKGTYQLK